MKQLIMMKGLPASGKSTWAKEEVKKNPTGTIRINNDDIRNMMGWTFTKINETVVSDTRTSMIESALSRWLNVIVDNTNLNPVHETLLRDLAKKHSAHFSIKSFDTLVDECIRRDSLRENPVWHKVIYDMANKYWIKDSSQNINMREDKPRCFVFDIDGTIADNSWRNPHDYSKVLEDKPYEDVLHLIKDLWIRSNIVFCSWRPDSVEKETKDWITKYSWYNFPVIYMRKSWDKRPDDIVKRELAILIAKDYYIEWVFDDRDRVVKMWREAWIRCYQVNYWAF